MVSIDEDKSAPLKMPKMAEEKQISEPVAADDEVPLFQEPKEVAAPEAMSKQRTDFRRLVEAQAEEIRIARTAALQQMPLEEPDDHEPALPSFLLERPGDYLSLDEVIPPDAERVRVGLKAARNLIDRAISKNVRVRDVLRDMLGLDSVMADEVIFELPLSDDDYRKLAMRFKLRPDHRDEIRARLQEELRKQLLK
jgi:hypothetical protein